MIEIVERAEVERILIDSGSLVPEAGAPDPGGSSLAWFRARVSRFVNGAEHDERRARLAELLDELDPAALARAATARAVAGCETRGIPATVLAEALGFTRPELVASLVEIVAAAYPTGEADEQSEADAAVTALLEASGAAEPDERALRVQLLVQSHAATSGFVSRAIARARSRDAAVPTRVLLESVLRDDSPVPSTRRLLPPAQAGAPGHGALATLRLDGPDRDAVSGAPPRILAFGAGPRACPAPHHALAIAEAIVEAARTAAVQAEGTPHADAR
jgi:hypothetical protein